MSPESLFRRTPDHLHVRLALEEWTELPEPGTRDWETLTQLLEATAHALIGGIYDVRKQDQSLYLLLRLNPAASVDAVVGALREQLGDPCWRPFIDNERFAWVGGYHVVSVRPGDTLDTEPLEHPARRGKRKHLEWNLKRSLPLPWHEAATPEVVGLEFVAAVQWESGRDRARIDLLYRKPATDESETAAAAHLNARLRVGSFGPLLESVGWVYRGPLPGLVFDVPARLLSEPPADVEVWWATDQRKRVATVPCYPRGTEPEF